MKREIGSRLAALAAGIVTGGLVAVAQGPFWAAVGFGCIGGISTFYVFDRS